MWLCVWRAVGGQSDNPYALQCGSQMKLPSRAVSGADAALC